MSTSPNRRPSIVWTRPARPRPPCLPQAQSSWVWQDILESLARCVPCYFPIWEAPPQVIFLPIKALLFFSHNIKGPFLHVVFPTTFAETTAFLTAHHTQFLHHISVKSSQVCGLSPCPVFFTYICIFLPLSPPSVKFNKYVVGDEQMLTVDKEGNTKIHDIFSNKYVPTKRTRMCPRNTESF